MNAARIASLASMLSLALSLHVFSVAAVADTHRDLSYTYIRLNGSAGEIDHRDSDGFGVAASFAISDEFYLTAAHTETDINLYYADVTSARQRLGLGFHKVLSATTDFIAEAAYTNARLTVDRKQTEDGSTGDHALALGKLESGKNGRDHGYELTLGGRSMAGESLALQVGARYIEIDGHTETTGYIAADYFVSEKISLGVGYEKSENSDAALLNARYHF